MPRTQGATNLTVRELGMKVVIATLTQENKVLKEALRAAQKALSAVQKAAQRK